VGPLPRIRILVSGPDGPFVDGICEALNGWGEVSVAGKAATIEDAASIAAHLAPDIVLADWESPAPESARAITALKRLPSAPIVIAITRGGTPAERSEALVAGADALLSHADPVGRLRELIRTIRAHLAPVPRPALYMSSRRD
jgi:DNA-binding NarL/FixJ family response regulator